MFEEYKRKIESIAGIERAATIVSDSIYIIFAGNNDIMTTYFTANLRSNYDIPSYINYLVQAASSFIKVCHSTNSYITVFFVLPFPSFFMSNLLCNEGQA
jgi:hypothetical protein